VTGPGGVGAPPGTPGDRPDDGSPDAGLGGAAVGLYPFVAARPRLSAVAGATFIAFSGIFFRFSGASPATATVYRTTLALPFLWLLRRYEERRIGPRTRHARILAAVAGFFFALDLLTWMNAVILVGAGLATVMANMQVVIVALAGWLLLGERPSGRLLAAIPVAIAGAVCISGILERGAYGADPALGVLFGLLAATAYSAYLLLIRRGSAGGRVFGPLLDASVVCAATGLVVGVATGGFDLTPGAEALFWLLAVALTSQVAGYGLISVSLPRLPAALTSLLLLVQPIVTVVAAAILLGEAPSPLQMLGVALILGGLLFATAPVGRVRAAMAGGSAETAPSIGGE
jgi:drug/metabolite transporter (DMT)-like permease